MKNIFPIVLIIIALASCGGDKVPEGIIPSDKIIDIMVDIHLSDGINVHRFSLGLTRDSFPEDIYLSLCKKHDVDHEILENSLYYYGRNPDKFTKIYDAVLNRLNEMDVESRKAEAPLVNPNMSGGDTIRNEAHSIPEEPSINGVETDTAKVKKESEQMHLD